MKICRLLILTTGFAGVAVAQDDPPAPAPFGPITLPGTDALYQQLLKPNVEGIGICPLHNTDIVRNPIIPIVLEKLDEQ